MDFCQSEPEGIVVGEASDATPLPQGVMFQPVVAPGKAIDPKCISLLLKDESKKEVKILQGTPLLKMQVADLVSSPVTGETSEEIDPRTSGGEGNGVDACIALSRADL